MRLGVEVPKRHRHDVHVLDPVSCDQVEPAQHERIARPGPAGSLCFQLVGRVADPDSEGEERAVASVVRAKVVRAALSATTAFIAKYSPGVALQPEPLSRQPNLLTRTLSRSYRADPGSKLGGGM